MVESRGIAHQMPLADQCRLVACLLQQLWKSLLRSVKGGGLVVIETVEMCIFSREHSGPARPAEGAGDKAALEEHAILRQCVEIRSLDQLSGVAICTDRRCGEIVAEDHNNVWPLCPSRASSNGGGKKNDEQESD